MIDFKLLKNGSICHTTGSIVDNREVVIYCDKEVCVGPYRFNKTVYGTGEVCNAISTPTIYATKWSDGTNTLTRKTL